MLHPDPAGINSLTDELQVLVLLAASEGLSAEESGELEELVWNWPRLLNLKPDYTCAASGDWSV